MNKLQFKLEDHVLQTLCSTDENMGLLIHSIGDYQLSLRTDYFAALVKSIIGQQLSVKAAGTIWQRTIAMCQTIIPEKLAAMSEKDLNSVGISRPKVRYIHELSQKLLNGEFDFYQLENLPDQEVICELAAIKGIGTWTAEMFLIFSLGRYDVFSSGDVGLKRAIQWLYRLEKTPAEKMMRAYAQKWIPYRSVASLYLWEVINRGFIKEDPANLKSKTVK